jgi:hypothetical protein
MEMEDENLTPRTRLALLAAVASGASLRSIARQFHVTLATVQHWVARSARAPVTTIADCLDHPRGPKACPNRTKAKMEERVLAARHKLGDSPLGEIGAEAIHASLKKTAPKTSLPSIRTIGRILERSGILDGKTRCRRPAPRPGWYLPALAAREAELDSFDGVEGLVIAGGERVEVFNAISLFGGLPASWPHPVLRTDLVLENLSEHWRRHGLPHYAQFDNDTLFQGAHQYADTLGRVVRLCLQLEVTPVFAPPREPGFQAAIENYNGRWQAKVWNRFQHADLAQLRRRSTAYVNALAARCTQRIERAPARRPWPASFTFQPLAKPAHLPAPHRSPRAGSCPRSQTPRRSQLAGAARPRRGLLHPRLHRVLRAPAPRSHAPTAPLCAGLSLPRPNAKTRPRNRRHRPHLPLQKVTYYC